MILASSTRFLGHDSMNVIQAREFHDLAVGVVEAFEQKTIAVHDQLTEIKFVVVVGDHETAVLHQALRVDYDYTTVFELGLHHVTQHSECERLSG
jgi:hypothetical protein